MITTLFLIASVAAAFMWVVEFLRRKEAQEVAEEARKDRDRTFDSLANAIIDAEAEALWRAGDAYDSVEGRKEINKIIQQRPSGDPRKFPSVPAEWMFQRAQRIKDTSTRRKMSREVAARE